MENQNLKDYALFCAFAEQAAKFGILLDFVQKGVTDICTLKSRKEQIAELEIIIG
jgi:hypothetical protein